MLPDTMVVADPDPTSGHVLTAPQIRYLETFGYLALPGLFADDIDEIVDDFDRVMADPSHWHVETHERIHFGRRRVTVPGVVDKGERLRRLRKDPRILGIVQSVLGPEHQWGDSDGNEFYCETSWHNDTYGADLSRTNIKITFYLDPTTAESGAVRVLPGSHRVDEDYGSTVRAQLREPDGVLPAYGVEGPAIPSWAVPTVPGDVLVWWYTTLHASFGCTERRRLFSMNYSAEQVAATTARAAITGS